MPLDYWGGLVEGFSGKREAAVTRKLEEDKARRDREGQIFQYLLQSKNPDMRALAMSGLFETAQPGRKKGGIAGYLGELEQGQIYPLVRAHMEELIPDEGAGGGPSPPRPGSAAMPTNQPVREGSQPINLPGVPLPPEPPPSTGRMTDTGYQASTGVNAAMPPDLAQIQGAPQAGPPPPPPESKFKRRGTDVPTAEETAEMQARVPLETRIGMAQRYLSEDDARRAIMGILGAPQSVRQFAAPTFAVEDPVSGNPVPVAFDYSTGRFFFTDGSPVPRGAKFVRMASGGTGGLTTKIPDTPEGRQYLLTQGADPAEVAGGSPTGYWKIVTRADGSVGVQADMYTPPPAYSGTATILDTAGNPVVAGVPRGGVPGGVVGSAASPQPSTEQASAQALLADVQRRITAAETPRLPGMPRRPLMPAQRDQIVREAAVAARLPYQTYFELEQATRIPTARQVAPRANAPAAAGPTQTPPVSAADKIRQRALEIERSMGRATTPPPPMGQPPVRARGAGPGPQR